MFDARSMGVYFNQIGGLSKITYNSNSKDLEKFILV